MNSGSGCELEDKSAVSYIQYPIVHTFLPLRSQCEQHYASDRLHYRYNS